MLVTLAAFIAGSTLGAKHLPWWTALPNIGTVPLIEKLGMPLALIWSGNALVLVIAIGLWYRLQKQ